MKIRFYFYRKGEELNHKLNGSKASGCGSNIKIDGEFKKGYKTKIYSGIRSNERCITCEDFDNKPVLVKHWFPSEVEWFWLIPEGYDISQLKSPGWNLVK